MNRNFIAFLVIILSVGTNAQTIVETVSSGTSGDATLLIEADTDNNNEGDNPRIQLIQDGGQTGAYLGFGQDWGGSNPDNLFRIGTRYGGVDSFDRFIINPQNGNVGIGTVSPISSLTFAQSTTGISFRSDGGTNGGKVAVIKPIVGGSGYGDLAFETYQGGSGGGERMRILNNGYIGIGTLSPTSLLHIKASNPELYIESALTGQSKILFGALANKERGSIKYSDNADALWFSTNNTQRIYINSSGNVGVGTSNPNGKLEVEDKTLGIVQDDLSNLVKIEGKRQFFKIIEHRDFAGGDWKDTSLRLQVGVDATEHQSIDFVSDGTYKEHIDIYAGNRVFNTRFQSDGNVGIGTNTPDSKLTVAGKVHAQEVKVTITAGADFVFEDTYQPLTLKELESFIKVNKHLPEIASAKEMETEGLELGTMNIKLLQKIEELTLYTIRQQKEMDKERGVNLLQEIELNSKDSKIKNLEEKMELQEIRLNKIEKLLNKN